MEGHSDGHGHVGYGKRNIKRTGEEPDIRTPHYIEMSGRGVGIIPNNQTQQSEEGRENVDGIKLN